MKHIITLLLALSLVCAVGALTAFAEPDVPDEVGEVDEAQQAEPYQEAEEQAVPEEQPQETPETPQEEQQAEEEPQNQWYDYIYSYDEDVNTYEAPENLNELPQAAEEQVIAATAVPMPTVAVSDASLFSGIVTWLCVALGIAVIVGVLVSKRTRRRGA